MRSPPLPTFCAGLAALLLAGCSTQPHSSEQDAGADAPDAAGTAADAASSADASAEPADAGEPPDAAAEPDAGIACWACHGTQASAAPPPDLSGSSDRTKAGVGAHAPHLAASTWHNAVKCSHCHVVPAAGDAAHGQQAHAATVTLQGLAAAGLTPSYSGGACSVYCHGATLRFGTKPKLSPTWTTAGALACTGCHGMPPPAPHPAATDCGRCHLDVADASGKIISASRHIEGWTTSPKGAHLVHLGGAGGSTYDCTTCHDGDRYHGEMKDQQPLETTTVCDGCHPTDTEAKRAAWDTWQPAP
ncbi:MAG TPA: hypothetical protein VGK67_34445 [Myxococcales bacterium]|jgi:predicted CxxxxCH...CXXCH cytochrome family protein